MKPEADEGQQIIVDFPNLGVTVRAALLKRQAPVTCEAIWEILAKPVAIKCRHAMYTGRELSTQLPQNIAAGTLLDGIVPENQTCFPQPGDFLYTFMPAYAWGGLPFPIFDVGMFYGRDARTFFPSGWIPGNRFAEVLPEDLEQLATMGTLAITKGEQDIVIRRHDGILERRDI